MNLQTKLERLEKQVGGVNGACPQCGSVPGEIIDVPARVREAEAEPKVS